MNDKFKEIKVILENDFATSYKNSEELNITGFNRAFHKLTHEKSGIGKIFPVYLKIDNQYYVLGIFTFNRLGSVSFFPELPQGTFFDHITFDKDIFNKSAHLTHLVDGSRKKVSPLYINHLTNGTYHIITFIFQDFSLLKLAPKEIICPPVDFDLAEPLKDALFTNGSFNGNIILDAVGTDGPVLIQFFIIPNGVDYKNLQLTPSSFNNYFKDEELKNILIRCFVLPKHEFQNDYQFGIVVGRYPKKLNITAGMEFPMKRSGRYFNSLDSKLNESVLKRTPDPNTLKKLDNLD
jgi:hypothetical protein